MFFSACFFSWCYDLLPSRRLVPGTGHVAQAPERLVPSLWRAAAACVRAQRRTTLRSGHWYTACLCYSVFDVDVADRSCAARKGRVCFLWSFLGQSRQIHQERKNVHTQIRSKRPVDTMTQCVFAIRFALCQVLNLWSATYTWGWVSLSRYHALAIVHCLLLHVCLFDCLLLVCCFEAHVRCARCSKITFVLRG